MSGERERRDHEPPQHGQRGHHGQESERDEAQELDEGRRPDDRYARGLEFLARTQGEKTSQRIDHSLRSISESFAAYSVASTYGEVFARERLELKHRQLVTIAIVATLGGCESQLRLHIRAGLNLGLSGDEIVEAIVQVGAYAGAPRASNAMLVAAEVFEREQVTVA